MNDRQPETQIPPRFRLLFYFGTRQKARPLGYNTVFFQAAFRLPECFDTKETAMTSPITRLGAGARLSEAVCAKGLVFLSGMVPENETAGAQAQTADVLRQIDHWLAQCGSDKRHILEATIYLADMADYAAMNAAWDAWVDPAATPARACVEARLAKSEWKVEIKVSALQTEAAA